MSSNICANSKDDFLKFIFIINHIHFLFYFSNIIFVIFFNSYMAISRIIIIERKEQPASVISGNDFHC